MINFMVTFRPQMKVCNVLTQTELNLHWKLCEFTCGVHRLTSDGRSRWKLLGMREFTQGQFVYGYVS